MKYFIKHYTPIVSLIALIAPLFSSCLKDKEEEDYSAWRQENIDFVAKAEAETVDGKKVYEKIVPSWAPGEFVLIKWHNDRALTANNLSPLDNSLVDIKYEMKNINGDDWGDSYSSTTYGDSIYQSRPCNNIVGMWAALTQMHVGDSVTLIIPASAAYGAAARSPILPYSALIYNVKLKKIKAYELPK